MKLLTPILALLLGTLLSGCSSLNFMRSSVDYDNEVPYLLGVDSEGNPVVRFTKTTMEIFLNPEITAKSMRAGVDNNFNETRDAEGNVVSLNVTSPITETESTTLEDEEGNPLTVYKEPKGGGFYLMADELNTRHNVEAIAKQTEMTSDIGKGIAEGIVEGIKIGVGAP